jgi:hypothetical protein
MWSTRHLEPALMPSAGDLRQELALIAVSTRPVVRERLKCICRDLMLGAPYLIERPEDAPYHAATAALLLVDLGSCARDAQLLGAIRQWELMRPDSTLVLFAPLLDRELELRLAVRLSRELRQCDVRLLTASQFCGDELRDVMTAWQAKGALVEELHADLMAAIAATGRTLPARNAVLDVLRGVTGAPPSAVPVLLDAESGHSRSATDQQRKARWRALHRGGQLPASQLSGLFRVLWYTRLRDLGWRTERIARFVGFRTARDFRRTVSRRLGVGLRELATLPYQRALAWVATELTDRSMIVSRPCAGTIPRPKTDHAPRNSVGAH